MEASHEDSKLILNYYILCRGKKVARRFRPLQISSNIEPWLCNWRLYVVSDHLDPLIRIHWSCLRLKTNRLSLACLAMLSICYESYNLINWHFLIFSTEICVQRSNLPPLTIDQYIKSDALDLKKYFSSCIFTKYVIIWIR